MSANLMANLLADERRNMVSNNYVSQSDYKNKYTHSERYQRHLGALGSIKGDNMGILYNDDSLGQLTHTVSTSSASGEVQLDVQSKWIIVNSGDRDWYNRNDENPYSFAVSVGPSSKYIDASGAERNIDITINQPFINVTKIECTSVMIPARELSNKAKPTNRPHLLLTFDKVNGHIFGSNKSLDNTSTVLLPRIPIPTDTYGFRHVEYINASGMAKEYLTPEATLGRLEVNITRQDGYNPWIDYAASDIININTIWLPNTAVNLLEIITAGFFNSQDFAMGDLVKLKGYIFRDTALGYKECNLFNQYINRDSGHIIQSIDKYANIVSPAYSGPMYNVIRILTPGYYSTITGQWQEPNWFSDPVNMGLVQKTTIDDTPSASSTHDNSGKGINTNTQTTMVIKIAYLDKPTQPLLTSIK